MSVKDNANPSGSGAAYSPDGNMTQRYAMLRYQRQQQRIGKQTPGRQQQLQKPPILKRYANGNS